MKLRPLFLSSLIFILLFGCSRPPQATNKIVIWHWMTDRESAFQELAKRYQQQTGIQVVFELYAPSDIYSQKIIAAAQPRVLPDIYGILDKKGVFASFITSGFVADLTEEFSKDNAAWEKSLFPKALSVNRFEENNAYGVKPGIYGVPIDVTNIQMLYNTRLLGKAGITNPPKTFNELLEQIDALKRVGIAGLVSGWGENWLVDCFASNYAFNIMGEEKIMATYRGEVPYTDPDWVSVFNVFKTLRERGALAEGIVTKSNKYAEQDFALERVAFAFNGSWCVNVYHDMNPDLQYSAILPPPVKGDKPIKIWGGAGSSFVVNNLSPNKNKAVDFLKWLTAKDQQAFLAEQTQNLPSNWEALESIPQILAEFASAMDSTTHPILWPLNEDPLVVEAFDKGVQAIIIGEKTPEEVASEVQQVKERQLERAKINK
jgi:raffinose/stachyose/melibiose transport system substrate-binding protein